MRKEFRVSLNVPDGASDEMVREYIAEAVGSWKGSLCPGTDDHESDPMFWLDSDSVKVTRLRRRHA